MTHVDARGDACPLPVVKAKRAISELKGAGQVEILVDNEIAVQNLTKMAQQKGYQYSAEKLAEREYRVLFTIGEAPAAEETPAVWAALISLVPRAITRAPSPCRPSVPTSSTASPRLRPRSAASV